MKHSFAQSVWVGSALMVAVGTVAPSAYGRNADIPFDAADFLAGAPIDNPYMTLQPGARFVYQARSEDGCEVDMLEVTGNTKSDFQGAYSGITAWEVHDRAWLSAECDGNYALQEDTLDWFAQDHQGNVWYFGEDTTAWDDEANCPSSAGSWQAGRSGARAGIVMLAQPRPGLAYRQEYLKGVAEDKAKVQRLNAKVSIALGDFTECLTTKEWSPLEKGKIETKSYCPSVGGLVLVEELKGPTLRVEWVGGALPPGNYAAMGACNP